VEKRIEISGSGWASGDLEPLGVNDRATNISFRA